MKLLFIHRSVGQQIVDAMRQQNKNTGLEIFDLNANTNQLFDNHKNLVLSPLKVAGGNTDPAGLNAFFTNVLEQPKLSSYLNEFDVIAFKSCYSAAAINSDSQLQRSKVAYTTAIRDFIQRNPSKKFIIISPPPRRPLFTNQSAAKRAAEFAAWLRGLTTRLPNCIYFDLFSLPTA